MYMYAYVYSNTISNVCRSVKMNTTSDGIGVVDEFIENIIMIMIVSFCAFTRW